MHIGDKKRSPPLKIVFFTHYSELYGANRSLLNLVDGLSKFNIDSFLISNSEGQITEEFHKRNLPYRVFNYSWYKNHPDDSSNAATKKLLRLSGNIQALSEIIPVLKEWDPDFIYSNSSVINIGFLASALINKHHIWHFREFWDLHYGLQPDICENTDNSFYDSTDKIICISRKLQNHLLKNKENSDVVYNGVTKEADIKKLKNKIISKGITFGVIGVLLKNKKFDEVITAFADVRNAVPDSRLIIAGDGPELSNLQSLAASLNIEQYITFAGFLENTDEFYDSIDVLIMSSVNEAFGRVTVEAMLKGNVVIANNSGANPEIVKEDCGIIYDNIHQLAEAMRKVSVDSEYYKSLRETAYAYAISSFTEEILAGNIYDILTTLSHQPPVNKISAFNLYVNELQGYLDNASAAQQNKITVATSIAPFGIEKQRLAVESWIKCGFNVVSLNSPEEISMVENEFPEVKFQPMERNAKEFAGKPIIYFDDVLKFLYDLNEPVCGIINSDIILNVDSNFPEFIRKETKGAMVYGCRTDILSPEENAGSIYEFGFDYFFFERDLVKIYPKSDLCLGLPWWDYWMVAIPLINKVKLKKIVSQAALHIWHTTNYDLKYWFHFGKFFFDYIVSKKLLPEENSSGGKDLQYNISNVSLNTIYLAINKSERIFCSVKKTFNLLPSITDGRVQGNEKIKFDIYSFRKSATTIFDEFLDYGLYREAEIIYVTSNEKESDNPENILARILLSIMLNKTETANSSVNRYLELTGDYNEIIKYYFKMNPDHFKPKVTAVISVYNSEKFIKGCIEDLLNQTLYKKNLLEIIIIDSGSEENEQAVIEEYIKNYPHILYTRTPRETIYQAWNKGIKLAQGDYITNANTDDRHTPDALEKMAAVLDNFSEYSVVYGDVYTTTVPNDTLNSSTEKTQVNWPDFDADLLLFGCYIGPQPLWRKSLHDKHGYFSETLKVVGDYEFWLRISRDEKFFHLKEKTGLYLYSETSAEHRKKDLTEQEDNDVKNAYMVQHVKSAEDLYRIKSKLKIISHVPSQHEYALKALEHLNQREAGMRFENEIANVVSACTESSDLHSLTVLESLIEMMETNFLVYDREKYIESVSVLTGSLFLETGDSDKAKYYFEKALMLNPESSDACCGLGNIFLAEGNDDAAEVMLNWAVKLNPKNNAANQLLISMGKITA